MEQSRKQAVVFITVFSCVSIIFLAITTPAVAAFPDFWFLGGDDWEPPENEPQMQLTESEYISLWGRTSTLLEGVESEDKMREKLNDAYDEFVSTEEGKGTFIGYFINGAGVDDPRPTVSKWNRNLNWLNTENADPVRGSPINKRPQIQNAYVQVMRPTPHTVWQFNRRNTRYVGDSVQVSNIVNVNTESRANDFNGLRGNNTQYRITDVRYENFSVRGKTRNGTVDEQDITHPRERVQLDLSSIEHDTPVTFETHGDIQVDENVTKWRYNCTEEETITYNYSYGGREYSYNTTRCVDYERETLETYTITKTARVSDELTGYTKYSPTVEIAYSAGKRDERRDEFFLDVQSNAPIDSVETSSQTLDYGITYFAARDTAFDDALGDVQPIDHYATPERLTPSVESRGESHMKVISEESNTQRNPKTSIQDDVLLRLKDRPYQNQFTRVRAHGRVDRGETFNSRDVRPQSIIPRDDSVTVNYTEADVDFETITLNVDWRKNSSDSYNQRVSVSTLNESGVPIDTVNKSNLEIIASNTVTGEQRVLETRSDGEVSFVMNASVGEQLTVELQQSSINYDSGGTVYLSTRETHTVSPEVDYKESAKSILGALFNLFLGLLPLLLAFSVAYWFFTGELLPRGIREKLKIG